MKKFALVLMLVCGFVSQANAGVLGSFLTTGENILEDGSRELLIKGAGNTGLGIEENDILIGFSKIVNITPANNYTPNSVYAIFSQTFDNISADLNPGAALLRTFDFKPTTAAGLTLSDLLGVLDPGGLDPSSMVALVSHTTSAFSADLELDSIGATIFSHLALLQAEGDLDAVFGLDTSIGSTDFFGGQTAVGITDLEDFITDLGDAPTDGSNLVNFEAQLSLTYDKPGLPHIVSGALVLGGTARLPGAGENVDGAFTFVNDADLKFSAVVPEPTSFSVFGLLGVALWGAAKRRRA